MTFKSFNLRLLAILLAPVILYLAIMGCTAYGSWEEPLWNMADWTEESRWVFLMSATVWTAWVAVVVHLE